MSCSFEPLVSLDASRVRQRLGAGRAVSDGNLAAVEASDPAVAPAVSCLQLPELRVPSEPRGEPTSASPFDAGVRLEDVREEGRRLGIEEGRRAAEKEVKEALARVAAVVSELERAIARNRREAEERIAVLASAIAGHLVEREIRTSPEVIADVVRRAVAMFPVVDSLTVHLNPADLAILAASDPETPGRSQLTSGQAVRWIADPTLLPGGCFVESAERVVDARLSRTLERICRALIDD